MAFHSFGGWKRSLFGDQHMHGPEELDFIQNLKQLHQDGLQDLDLIQNLLCLQ